MKNKMKDKLEKAILEENEQELMNYLDCSLTKDIDPSQYGLIEKALTATWHSQHEDLVSAVLLEKLIDDRFVDPVLDIALNEEKFRWYDDELEATLRKCVHVLKMINSEKSNQALNKLKGLNNDNIKIILNMYE